MIGHCKHWNCRADRTALTVYLCSSCRISAEAFLLIGIDPILDRPLRTWRTGAADSPERSLPWMKLMTEPDTLLVGEAVLQSPGSGSGDGVELAGPRGVKRFPSLARSPLKGSAWWREGAWPSRYCDIRGM